MSAITEIEIFDCLRDNLQAAISECDTLAVTPKRGKLYDSFRQHLSLVEGACRQAGHWREDARFFPLSILIEQVHQKAGDWLRGVEKVDSTGRRYRVPLSEGQKHPAFKMLADNLRSMLAGIESLRTAKTGVRGPILPQPLAAPGVRMPENYAVALPEGMKQRQSGLIVPSAA